MRMHCPSTASYRRSRPTPTAGSPPLSPPPVFPSTAPTVLPSSKRNLLLLFAFAELPEEPPKPLWRSIAAQFSDHLVQILLLAALVSFLLAYFSTATTTESAGNAQRMSEYIEPIVILAILIINATVGVVQEGRAEQAINVRIIAQFAS